jgi:hypothetical protein
LKNLAGPENFTCFVERTTKSSNSQPLDYGGECLPKIP